MDLTQVTTQLAVVEWYRWGVWAALTATLAALFWVFFDSAHQRLEPTAWKAVCIVAAIWIAPSAMMVAVPSLALRLMASLEPLAYLGWLSGLAALLALVFYQAGIARGEPVVRSTALPPRAAPPRAPLSYWPESVSAITLKQQKRIPTSLLEQPASSVAMLVMRAGTQVGREYRLEHMANLGREGSRNDIVLDDPVVSSEHARIRFESGAYYLYDLASTNGTWLRNHPGGGWQRVYGRCLLSEGDRLQLGNTELVFVQPIKPGR